MTETEPALDMRKKLAVFLEEKKKLEAVKRATRPPVFRPGGGVPKDTRSIHGGSAYSANSTMNSTVSYSKLSRMSSMMNLSRAPSQPSLTIGRTAAPPKVSIPEVPVKKISNVLSDPGGSSKSEIGTTTLPKEKVTPEPGFINGMFCCNCDVDR